MAWLRHAFLSRRSYHQSCIKSPCQFSRVDHQPSVWYQNAFFLESGDVWYKSRPLKKTNCCPILETTLGQMQPPKSGHHFECYLIQVAFPETRLDICPQLDSRAASEGWWEEQVAEGIRDLQTIFKELAVLIIDQVYLKHPNLQGYLAHKKHPPPRTLQ